MSDQQAARTIAAVLKNIARIGLVVQPSADYKQPFSDQDHATITQMVREQFGSDDAGGEAIFNRRLDLSYPKPNSLEGLAMREVRDVIEDRMCVALGIHSSVVGFSGGMRATRIGAVQSSNVQSTWEGGLIPVLSDIAEQAGDFLLPLYGFDNDAYSLAVDLSRRCEPRTKRHRNARIGSASWSRRRHHHARGGEGHPREGRGPVMGKCGCGDKRPLCPKCGECLDCCWYGGACGKHPGRARMVGLKPCNPGPESRECSCRPREDTSRSRARRVPASRSRTTARDLPARGRSAIVKMAPVGDSATRSPATDS